MTLRNIKENCSDIVKSVDAIRIFEEGMWVPASNELRNGEISEILIKFGWKDVRNFMKILRKFLANILHILSKYCVKFK